MGSRYALYKDIGEIREIGETGNPNNSQNNDNYIMEIKSADDKYNIINSADGLVVVDIYGTWCQPCKDIYPKYVELSKKYPNVLFCKENVNLDLSPNVTAVPCFHFFKNGKYIPQITYIGGDISPVEQTIIREM